MNPQAASLRLSCAADDGSPASVQLGCCPSDVAEKAAWHAGRVAAGHHPPLVAVGDISGEAVDRVVNALAVVVAQRRVVCASEQFGMHTHGASLGMPRRMSGSWRRAKLGGAAHLRGRLRLECNNRYPR